MPTKREREYYAMGFRDGVESEKALPHAPGYFGVEPKAQAYRHLLEGKAKARKPKRKLSAWNKFVKANSKKAEFRFSRSTGQYRKGQLNLKKMAVAFRKKKRRR